MRYLFYRVQSPGIGLGIAKEISPDKTEWREVYRLAFSSNLTLGNF